MFWKDGRRERKRERAKGDDPREKLKLEE